MGHLKLNFAELKTLLIDIECIINNRTITYEYEEISHEMLTPIHLLYGYRVCNMSDDIKINRKDDDISCRAKYLTH